MTLKRFCDICKAEAKGGYAFLNTSKSQPDTIDLCKNCEKAVLAVLKKKEK